MNDKKEKEIKTADYTRRAVDNYHNKKDLFSLALRKGTKNAIRDQYGDIKLNDYFQSLVDADLNGDKKPTEPRPEPAPKKTPKKSAADQPTIKAENPADDPANDPALIFENFKS